MVRAHLVLLFVLSFACGAFCGQIFTNGLSIIDAPSADTPAHAGATLPIAVEVSGNGQLPADSANPSSSLPTHISLLEIYLVSSDTNLNITVSSGPSFLTSETGSVRHLDWPVPTCLPAGNYNLTFYETFQLDSVAHFTITPVRLTVQNPQPSSRCTNGNPLQPQPQTAAPLDQSPFVNPSSGSTSSSPTLITITVSDGGFQFPTITKTVTPTVTTQVVVSLATLTTTVTGQQGLITSVFTQTYTTTEVLQQSGNAGFIPVNSGLSVKFCSRYLLSAISLAWLYLYCMLLS